MSGAVSDIENTKTFTQYSREFNIGVTFLAFGNGAPDIFSSIAAIRQSNPQLVVGELYGAGIFVTTVVAGTIFILSDFKPMARPLCRDIVFYVLTTFLSSAPKPDQSTDEPPAEMPGRVKKLVFSRTYFGQTSKTKRPSIKDMEDDNYEGFRDIGVTSPQRRRTLSNIHQPFQNGGHRKSTVFS
ncbi:unnamed protein product, partial [Oppiella nova]